MKNRAINTLEYTGVVTLSQYVGDKKLTLAKLSNEGGYSLFNFFADCLVGEFDVAAVNRPTKIMLLHVDKTDGSTMSFESRSGFIYQTSSPEKTMQSTTSAVGSVRYSFIVPKDLLSGKDANDVNYIGLYANAAQPGEESNFAALVGVNFAEQNVSASSAVLIDWELNIYNRNKT